MRRRTTHIIASALVLITLVLSASASADVRDEVVALLAAEPGRADLVVVLDTSGSMKKHFGEVKTFARNLASAARPGDTLTLIGFGEKAGNLSPPFEVRAGGAQQLQARLNKMQPPSARYTDLGAGLEALLDALVRPNYAPVSLVFMITDFCSEPPPNSPFAGAVEGEGPCRELKLTESLLKKSARLRAAGDQAIKTFALALEPVSDSGLRAAGEVLGSLVRINVTASELKRELSNVHTRIGYARAGLAVEQILKRPPLTLSAPLGPVALQGARDLEVGLLSEAPFPSTVRITRLKALDQSIEFELLAPARTFDLPRRAKAKGQPAKAFKVRATGLETVAQQASEGREEQPFEYTRDVELELTVELELEPRAAIEKILGGAPQASAVIRQRMPVHFVPPERSVVPLAVTVAPGAERIELNPHSEAPLPVVVTSLTPWANLEAVCEIGGHGTGTLKLLPKASVESQLAIDNQVPPQPFRLQTRVERQVRLSGTCVVTAISPSGIRVPRGSYPISLGVTVTWQEGIPVLPVLLVLGALLVGIAFYIREVRLRIAPAALSGRLVVYAGPGEFRQVTVPLDGMVTLAVQGGPAAEDQEVRLDGGRLLLPGVGPTLLELYADKSDRRRMMRMRLVRGEVTQEGQALGTAPVAIQKGRTRFSVGNYDLRVEK